MNIDFSVDTKLKDFDDFAQEPVVVVCAADNNYSMPLAVTIRSALENLGSNRSLLCFVIDGGIKKVNKNKILKSVQSERCNVVFIPRNDSLLGKFTVLSPHQKVSHEFNYLNIVAYYRLILPELIPIQYEKVIYLDCDLVVLNDLGQLWDLSLNDNYALAVPDLFGYSIVRLPNYQELGITPDRKYFNSGVLVLNLKKWRLDEVTSKCVTYLKQERENVLYHDQDVLNAILGNDWAELDPRWNVTPAIHHVPCEKSPYEEALYKSLFSNPYIVHYSTAAKPWGTHNLAFNDSFPFKDIFFHYLDMTVWSGWRLTARRLLAAKLSRKFRLLQAITGN